MKLDAIRLEPGQDLKKAIEEHIMNQDIKSGFVMTCVGSLHKVTLRMAGAKPDLQEIRTLEGHFEIVSLVGTLSQEGSHLHLSVSNENGEVFGGHLKNESVVTTTAEVVIGYDEKIIFNRVLDPATGFDELSVS